MPRMIEAARRRAAAAGPAAEDVMTPRSPFLTSTPLPCVKAGPCGPRSASAQRRTAALLRAWQGRGRGVAGPRRPTPPPLCPVRAESSPGTPQCRHWLGHWREGRAWLALRALRGRERQAPRSDADGAALKRHTVHVHTKCTAKRLPTAASAGPPHTRDGMGEPHAAIGPAPRFGQRPWPRHAATHHLAGRT